MSETTFGISINSKRAKSFKLIFKILGWIGTAFSTLAGIVVLSEWFRIGVIANPEVIKKYYFGSEVMIAHGGWIYKSASIYTRTSLIEGITFLTVAAIFALSIIKEKQWCIYLGYSFWIVFYLWFYISTRYL